MIVETFNAFYSVEEPSTGCFVATKLKSKAHDPQLRIPEGRVITGNQITLAVGQDMVIRQDGVLRIRTTPVMALHAALRWLEVPP